MSVHRGKPQGHEPAARVGPQSRVPDRVDGPLEIQFGVEAPAEIPMRLYSRAPRPGFAVRCGRWCPWIPRLRQAPGLGAVAASHDEHGVHSAGQLLDLGLAFLRGVADRVEDDRLGDAPADLFDDGPVLVQALRRLGHNAGLLHDRQAVRFLAAADDDAAPVGIAQEAVHLGVFRVAYDDNPVVPRGMLRSPTERPTFAGVDDHGPLFRGFRSGRRRGDDTVVPSDPLQVGMGMILASSAVTGSGCGSGAIGADPGSPLKGPSETMSTALRTPMQKLRFRQPDLDVFHEPFNHGKTGYGLLRRLFRSSWPPSFLPFSRHR